MLGTLKSREWKTREWKSNARLDNNVREREFWLSIRVSPAFSTLFFWCHDFHSRDFHPFIFYAPAFSTPAFSVASKCCMIDGRETLAFAFCYTAASDKPERNKRNDRLSKMPVIVYIAHGKQVEFLLNYKYSQSRLIVNVEVILYSK